MWIGGIRVRKAIRLGSTPEGGEVAPGGVRDDLPTRLSSIDRGRRRPGHAEPTTTRDVEPKTWALARHGLSESATSIARHPPGRGLVDA
jgi:hypothetical protein